MAEIKEKLNQSRIQKRYQERTKQEVLEVHDKLVSQFFEFFITHKSPEGEEVSDKLDQLNAQWKTYCQVKHLKDFARDLFIDSCNEILKTYNKNKPPVKIKVVEPPSPKARYESFKRFLRLLNIGKNEKVAN